jgi:hypothetical protein
MKKIIYIHAIILLMSVMPLLAEENIHPTTYIDEGACPFECCTYREWIVKETADIQISPDMKSQIIGTAVKGDKVDGVTGIVIVDSPGKVEVVKECKSYKKGDIIWVYTYLGEGFYKVWFDGKMYVEDVYFMSGWAKCTKDGTCWGKVIAKPQSTWWVKIKNKAGIEGWSNKPQNFGNNDSCH